MGITGVGLLPTIDAAPVMIGIDLVAIVVGIIKVIGNHVKKTCSHKIEKHKKIDMLASITLNTINDLVFKALRNNTISDNSQISLEFDLVLEKLELQMCFVQIRILLPLEFTFKVTLKITFKSRSKSRSDSC